MSEDVFLPLLLACLVFFVGYYGFATERWPFAVFTFIFAPIAGLLMGFAALKFLYPELSQLRQLEVGAVTVVLMVVVLLGLFVAFQWYQRRRR